MVRQVLIRVDHGRRPEDNCASSSSSSSFMVDVDGEEKTPASASASSLTLQDLLDKLPRNILPKSQQHEVLATYKGRVLNTSSSLVVVGGGGGSGDDGYGRGVAIGAGDVLHLRTARLCGGGGDGGSTGAEDRRAWLEMFLEKKPDKVDPREVKKAKWTRCQISGQKLCPPCVVDGLGNLYNKEVLVKSLLTKSIPPECSHIKGLKDVTAIKLVRSNNGGEKKSNKVRLEGDIEDVASDFEFQCPITGLEMNGRFRFYVVLPSGHVVSHRAVKEAKQCVEELLVGEGSKTGKGTIEELIPINGSEEEVKALREKLEAARLKKLQKKLDKKNKKSKGKNKGNEEDKDTKTKEEKRARDEKDLAAAAASSKRPKSVYESLFTSSQQGGDESSKETFLCRSTSARGMSLS